MGLFKRIRDYKWVLRSLPKTIYFNFRVLPFTQAIRLPIWLYRPHFGELTGGVFLDVPSIRTGMVKLGHNLVNVYPNNGIFLDIKGKMVFKGDCEIGNSSSISVGKTGALVFGNGFLATTSIKIICYNSISFGKNVLVGWDCLFLDTDFHSLTKPDGTRNKGYGPIVISDNVWLGCGCKIFKRTVIPKECVVSAQTILAENVNFPDRSVIGNQYDVVKRAEGYYRDAKNDKVYYKDK